MVANGPKTAARLGTAPNLDTLTCELCSKTYQRRDLLMRHRRRCVGPTKPQNRRKACNACVAAKTRCSYEQPTCSRCAKRATSCVYASRPDMSNGTASTSTENPPDSDMDTSDSSDASGTPPSPVTTLDPRSSFSFTPAAEIVNPPLWDTTVTSSWPLDSFNLPLQSTMEDPMSLLNFETNTTAGTPMPTNLGVVSDYSFSQLGGLNGAQSPNAAVTLPFSPTSWNMPFPMQTTPPPIGLPALDKSGIFSVSSFSIARLLADYPSKLLYEQFASPLLHHSLFTDNVADMTTLPLTSMAICCAVGLEARNSRRFVKRAINAERQRLIEVFPSYHCMEQWDALHAMIVYEVLDLREGLDDDLETWKPRPKVKGLQSPFLLKMIQRYVMVYPALRNAHTKTFSDPASAPTSGLPSAWGRWRITETARRTMFFANVVNFYTHHNHSTQQQSPYYQALDDDLILNMPLPCSERAWTAGDESSWLDSMQADRCPEALHSASGITSSEETLQEITLKTLFSGYSKADIKQHFARNIGFDDSEKLRSLIVICACQQFS